MSNGLLTVVNKLSSISSSASTLFSPLSTLMFCEAGKWVPEGPHRKMENLPVYWTSKGFQYLKTQVRAPKITNGN